MSFILCNRRRDRTAEEATEKVIMLMETCSFFSDEMRVKSTMILSKFTDQVFSCVVSQREIVVLGRERKGKEIVGTGQSHPFTREKWAVNESCIKLLSF